MTELGNNLKALRGELSQAAFARILGVKQQTYANWELGTREPDVTTLCRIAKVVGKSVDELVGIKSLSPDRSYNKVADLKRAIITLLKEY